MIAVAEALFILSLIFGVQAVAVAYVARHLSRREG